ncbi:acyl-CoA dehydrogenase family protein [Streptomyces sp. 769]|uniref:acyl-CoA dehydrogenase family protein n=1 Tax=Streptomyces sp. 769 TaxID=1262452 RepID=UPI00058007D4|nr:acyl-CoA dehydrogenase family protein [Streptomyces sp. 769]AJC52686.1 acyl-CoA dehydrogenase type 2 domain-containing protein [Streptomyces sp. 769]AJC61853.1 acyl-CoA dehydrogenase type 2 domain-containing protein [Streptomyces sp. 769]
MTATGAEAAAILQAVEGILPDLRENSLEAEERRWIPDENIALLEKTGIFRMGVPRRFGGLDLPLAEQIKILTELPRGCGSTGWVAMVWAACTWLATLYPEEAQQEVFADSPVRISGGFTPSGSIVPADGGFVISGTWRFNTGCRGAHWDILAALQEHSDGQVEQVFALVPMADLTIADDWDVTSGSGTGSCSVSAQDVFVPAHRVASGVEATMGGSPQRSADMTPGRNYYLTGFVNSCAIATYIGIAKAVLELFTATAQRRGISYTSWTEQHKHPLTQIKVATAANQIAAAEALSDTYIALMQERADAGELPTVEEMAAFHGKSGYALQLVRDAVTELHCISGASVISRKDPFQRHFRDLMGFSLHGMMAPHVNLELHGRVLLGLDPDTDVL